MSYSEFTLERSLKAFNLTSSETANLFASTAPIESSNFLKQTLEYNVPLALAIATEKARSELIIAPILLLRSPVVTLVEAKKDNINGGLGQCIAEMVAAQLFNEKEGTPINTIYGAVTSGNVWKFLKLEQQVVGIDLTEYYLQDLNRILGILAAGL